MIKERNTLRDQATVIATGKVIKEIRYFFNLKQAQFAAKIGITQPQLCAYESGVIRFPFDLLFHMTTVFELNPMVIVVMIIDRIRFEDPLCYLSIQEYIIIFEGVEKYREERIKNQTGLLQSLMQKHLP